MDCFLFKVAIKTPYVQAAYIEHLFLKGRGNNILH
jgi:hypothetical protein